eukprot:GCRY01004790.1.p1 GENE.GCRY01004790.1~~GCRY01004790.1.p1  ORF type:complete len:220 (+),score=27.75 GCRY01004790.1:672-1331(+)
MGPVFLHNEYKEASQQRNKPFVSRTIFSEIWMFLLPHIKVQTPRSDICSQCDKLTRMLPTLNANDFEEKLKELQSHREKAVEGRQQSKDDQNESREIDDEMKERIRTLLSPQENTITNEEIPLTVPLFLSFDYAQQVHVPFSSQQVGELYFKTPRKVQLFGVTMENTPFFFLYLIDEAESAGKGADAVISLVHHTIFNELKKINSKTLKLQADKLHRPK